MKRKGQSKKIYIEEMACIFERLATGQAVKAIAIDFDVHYETLRKWIRRAKNYGFKAWR